MAWNSKPEVRDAGEYAKKHGFVQIIIIGISLGGEQYQVITYGKNKSLCDAAKSIGDRIAENADRWY